MPLPTGKVHVVVAPGPTATGKVSLKLPSTKPLVRVTLPEGVPAGVVSEQLAKVVMIFVPVVMAPLVSVSKVLTLTLLLRVNPLELLTVRLLKFAAPVSVCAELPENVQIPVPAANAPLLLKLPFSVTEGLLVLPAKEVLVAILKLPRISSVPEAGVLVLPPDNVRFG